jgi:hypothetical protein
LRIPDLAAIILVLRRARNRDIIVKEGKRMSRTFSPAAVECYSGYRGEETPRTVVIDGKRLEIVAILSRARNLDASTGLARRTWGCRLDDGRTMTVELLEDGAWRVSSPD